MKLPIWLGQFETPIQIARQALLKNKVRTILSILGVVIGIAAVIIVLSVGQGIKGFLIGQLTTFGTDYIEVEIKVPNAAHTSTENATGLALGVQITTLKESDMKEILKLDNVRNAYSGSMTQQIVSYQGANKQTFIFATSASYSDIDPTKVSEGRYFTDEEDNGLARVAVLGPNLKQTLFGDEDAIGKEIKVGRGSYKVIGVMDKRGAQSFFDFDSMMYLPIHTVQKLIIGVDYVTFIFVQVKDNSISDLTAADIIQLMRERHNITDPNRDDFAVMTEAEAMNMLNTIVGAITLLLIAIAGISLVVGGIGIMNIMYVSVAERTFEIGLRKAVGAKSADILRQFLMEAIFVTFSGGVFGIIIGSLVSYLITVISTYLGFNWKFVMSPLYLLLACGVSIMVGLISGLYPARAAANLDPIVALRQE
ncbi:MAG: ABC transporter permease [Candidatus Parcubacteria bacterium]|nr:ABC transporter permease [Candidatus Parcubacteria bacterium]